MKNIWIGLAFLAVACGNPHVSSVKSGLETTNPPASSEDCEPNIQVSDYRFFFDSAAPQIYKDFSKCRSITSEDFNIFNDGAVPELSNAGRTDVPYVLTHRSEISHDPEKVQYLEEIFGMTTYDLIVENPVEYNGDIGVDRGADSGSVSETSNDALVWKFTTPVSMWSARPVGLKHNSVLRIFNCDEELIKKVNVQGRPRFVGFIAPSASVCYVSLSAAGGTDSVVVDDFEYGN